MIFLIINSSNFSRLVWRRHTCHTAPGARMSIVQLHGRLCNSSTTALRRCSPDGATSSSR